MLLSLSSAMRGRQGANASGNASASGSASGSASKPPASPSSATPDAQCHTPGDARRDVVVGETPEGAKGGAPGSSSSAASVVLAGERPSAAKKQRSIHDFFGSSRRTPSGASATPTHARKPPRLGAPLGRASSSSSLQDSEEFVKKRIDYDDTSSLDDPEEDMMEEALSLSQNSEATATPRPLPLGRAATAASSSTSRGGSSVSVVRPKRIDFGGICPSSQRSEPDVEPSHVDVVVPAGHADSVVRSSSQSASQSYGGYGAYGGYSAYGGGMFSQDELDFCTPADQPVVHMSHPTTPSPMKKRQRRSFGDEHDNDDSGGSHVVQEDVQNLTQDMTHMDVRRPETSTAKTPAKTRVRGGASRAAPLPSFSSSDSNDLLLATPQRVLGLPTGLASHRRDAVTPNAATTPFAIAKAPPRQAQQAAPSVEAFTNPFAPVPAVDSRKRRKFRQSFPPTFGSAVSVPYSRYLSEFIEQELLGSGAFSKVFKCVKKIDGWTYAIKKSKRHLRGRADTERALREVQALAALSDSRHVVRYFDAWIEDELLYIQLEHCASCSLASFVDAHKPLHVPEETLCKVLCHLAQALKDLHGRHMVHMDVKLPNVLIAPGEVYKLGDLGTVARADGSMDITEGDNRYLSRELLEGSRANLPAGDVFALGATIYELALGATLPSGGEEWQKLRDGDLALFRQYTNSLQHLIAGMMHPDPLQRPSAEEILQHEVVRPYVGR